MSWIGRMWRRKRLESDLEKEVRYHLERQTADLVAQGVEPGEAKRQAKLMLGGAEQVKEACRDERGGRWLEDFARDCRYAVRILKRSPVFTGAAVLSLALGIGANTAIFSLVDLVMLRMMPVHEPERLVQFQKIHPEYGRGSVSYPLFERLQKELESFDGLLAEASLGQREVRIGGELEKVRVEMVSGTYYEVLGVTAQAGRTFGREVDGPVAVISDGFWKRRFARDPAAIGKTFQLSQTVFTIVGVTPPEFFGTVVGRAVDVTVPLTMDGEARGGESWRKSPGRGWLSVMGRLKDGRSIEEAATEVKTLYARIVAEPNRPDETEFYRKARLAQRMEVQPAGNGFDELRSQFSAPLSILMGVVALVLLLACANLANLLLAKSAARRREIAVRMSIGAGRGRIVRQLLTEGLLLSLAGGALGAVLAYWAGNGLVTMMSNGGPRMALEVRPDARVLGFALMASVAACLMFSLAPAVQATRQNFQPALAEIRATRWRLGKGLIVAQVALSLVLVIGAGLFGRTLLNMYSMDAGFDRHGVLMFGVTFGKEGYKGERLRDAQARVLSELRSIPGVTAASLGLMPPLSGGGWDGSLTVEGYTHAPDEDDKAHLNSVGPEYFKTLGTPVQLGREFEERDGAGAPKVAVVNETFARYYFKGRSPIGKWLSLRGPTPGRTEIIGVVKDVKYRNLRQEFPRTVYFAILQSENAPDWHTYVVRTAGGAGEMARSFETAVERADKRLRIQELRSLEDHVARSVLQERMMATLAGFFGMLALLLAAIGIYGVMAFQVAQRQKEIGIRLALGARPLEMVRMVMGQTGRLALAGGLIGVTAALLLARLVDKMLFGVTPQDPATVVMASSGLLAVALAAAYLPGRTAARTNPIETLRCD